MVGVDVVVVVAIVAVVVWHPCDAHKKLKIDLWNKRRLWDSAENWNTKPHDDDGGDDNGDGIGRER